MAEMSMCRVLHEAKTCLAKDTTTQPSRLLWVASPSKLRPVRRIGRDDEKDADGQTADMSMCSLLHEVKPSPCDLDQGHNPTAATFTMCCIPFQIGRQTPGAQDFPFRQPSRFSFCHQCRPVRGRRDEVHEKQVSEKE
ncbi:hypothetical protein B0H19DRAFT_326609 [Mycena capillaripes]|nr:hypothetical protein B0H19DRAFT_326609 [Mycena capillaripes]